MRQVVTEEDAAMSEPMTRREFVGAAAAVGAIAAVSATTGCAGAGTGAGGSAKPKVETPSTSYGGSAGMGKRLLVGYATRAGSTVGVAEAIGETLAGRGFEVDVKPLAEKPSLDGYDAVVLGSAINGAQWLPEALGFAESNRDALGRVPVALFCVHAMNCGPDPKKTKRRLAYLDKVRAVVRPVDEGFFAGKGLDPEETSAFARWAFKLFGGDIEGDGRDWKAIRGWASETPMPGA
jgi:menaquinone-dependent protoporphyrinogen oxidase